MLKIVEVSLLYDFYGQLLTEKQRKVLGLYYNDDLSLGEISENLSITRQAVYDNIKRAEKLLYGYEDKLKLVEKFVIQQEKIKFMKSEITEFKTIVNCDEHEHFGKILQNIESVLDELLID